MRPQGGYILLLVLLLSVVMGAMFMLYEYSSLLAPAHTVPSTSLNQSQDLPEVSAPQTSPLVPIQEAQQVKTMIETQQQLRASDLR